jgi:hypothetical protein
MRRIAGAYDLAFCSTNPPATPDFAAGAPVAPVVGAAVTSTISDSAGGAVGGAALKEFAEGATFAMAASDAALLTAASMCVGANDVRAAPLLAV